MTKIACAQFDPKIFETASNLKKMEAMAREAAAKGARLVVFPECATTGYCIESKEEALQVAEAVPGETTKNLKRFAWNLTFISLPALSKELGTTFIIRRFLLDRRV